METVTKKRVRNRKKARPDVLPRVINFSGGKTSAYMTIKYYRPGDIVIFCDTGREHPKTYKFINDFEAHEQIPIHRIKWKDQDNPFAAILAEKNYKQIPNRVKRFCTKELKIVTAKRYLKHVLGIKYFENYIGFRADEPQRVLHRKAQFKKVHDVFPLYTDGVNKAMVNAYWATKPYTLEIPSILGNCTLCFMKGKNAIVAILTVYPELAEPWLSDEETSQGMWGRGGGHTYLKDITVKQMLALAQNNLWTQTKSPEEQKALLEQMEAHYACACTA